MKKYTIAIMLVLASIMFAGCHDNEPNHSEGPRACQLEWVGSSVETVCDSMLEVTDAHTVLWTTTEDGHRILVVTEGHFPTEFSLTANPSYVAVEPSLVEGPCDDDTIDDPPAPPTISLETDGWGNVVASLDAHVNCNGEWRYIHLDTTATITRKDQRLDTSNREEMTRIH